VTVRRSNGAAPPRLFSDYAVDIDDGALPEGVSIQRMI
jgi:hypothetical protein